MQQTMGPLTLTRSAEGRGGPHEPWFWDPARQAAVLPDMGCIASRSVATCGPWKGKMVP